MAPLSSTSSSRLLRSPPPPFLRPRPRRAETRSAGFRFAASARRRDHAHEPNFDGRTVDENMIVLRMRIHEMKAVTEEGSREPPGGWMKWEERYYDRYGSDVCEAVRVLQDLLMNTRPSVALAMLVLVGVSVPVTSGVVVLRFVELVKWVISAIHLL